MPDQSSASSEHAIMQEITAPLATLPDDAMPLAADVDFPMVLRGYDRIAVDAYVKKTSQLVAELQATRSPEAAVRRALERVGEEVSGILQRAHDTAEQVTTQSRSEAEDRLEAARQEARQLIEQAQARLRELDAETDRIWAERHRIVEDTRDLARQLLALAGSAAERFPPAEEVAGSVGGDEDPAARATVAGSGSAEGEVESPPGPAGAGGSGMPSLGDANDAEATAALPPLEDAAFGDAAREDAAFEGPASEDAAFGDPASEDAAFGGPASEDPGDTS